MERRFSRYYVFIKPVLKNKYFKTYSGLIFGLITIMIFAVFAIKPTIETIISLQKSIEEQNALLQTIKDKSKNLSLARTNYQAIDPSVKTKIHALLPNSPTLPSFVQTLASIAEKEQASMSSLQFQPVDLQAEPKKLSKSSQVTEIPFTVNMQGGFQQLINILNSLSKTTRLITIEQVNFTKPEDGVLIMSINGKAYYFK